VSRHEFALALHFRFIKLAQIFNVRPALAVGAGSKFGKELMINMLFPMSLPLVLFSHGIRGARNHIFFPLECNAREIGLSAMQWLMPIALVVLFVLDTTLGTDRPGSDSVHSSLLLLAAAMAGRHGLVAAKYGFMTDHEYTVFKTEKNAARHRATLSAMQLLTGWTTPSASLLRAELHAASQRLGLELHGVLIKQASTATSAGLESTDSDVTRL